MNNRDLLREFIQWIVDNPDKTNGMFDPDDDFAPEIADEAVDAFLASIGEPSAAP